MTLNTLSLSLQFGRFDGVAAHRAVLPRHKVTRWIRHALATEPMPKASSVSLSVTHRWR